MGDRAEWKSLRAKIQPLEAWIHKWCDRHGIYLPTVKRASIPAEIFSKYSEAVQVFRSWSGIAGCMTKMVLGHYCAGTHEISQSDQAEAQRRLKEDFAFVGLTDEWHASICLFHQSLGGDARAVEFLNVRTGDSSEIQYNTSVMEGWHDQNDEDLYF